jgi:hypothetical protein
MSYTVDFEPGSKTDLTGSSLFVGRCHQTLVSSGQLHCNKKARGFTYWSVQMTL